MSTPSHIHFNQHKALVEASSISGTNKVISSEYDVDMRITASQSIPYRAPKTVIQNMLSKSNLMYSSYLYTVPFLEWGIEHFLFGIEDVHS